MAVNMSEAMTGEPAHSCFYRTPSGARFPFPSNAHLAEEVKVYSEIRTRGGERRAKPERVPQDAAQAVSPRDI